MLKAFETYRKIIGHSGNDPIQLEADLKSFIEILRRQPAQPNPDGAWVAMTPAAEASTRRWDATRKAAEDEESSQARVEFSLYNAMPWRPAPDWKRLDRVHQRDMLEARQRWQALSPTAQAVEELVIAAVMVFGPEVAPEFLLGELAPGTRAALEAATERAALQKAAHAAQLARLERGIVAAREVELGRALSAAERAKAAQAAENIIRDFTEQLNAPKTALAGEEAAASNSARKMAFQEALEKGEINATTAQRAGVAKPPQHHIFPQAERQWFADRGVDIDKFTVKLDQGSHEALHYGGGPGKGGGWWNEQIMKTLTEREAALGRMLTPQEIEAVGKEMMSRAKISNLPIVPYKEAP